MRYVLLLALAACGSPAPILIIEREPVPDASEPADVREAHDARTSDVAPSVDSGAPDTWKPPPVDAGHTIDVRPPPPPVDAENPCDDCSPSTTGPTIMCSYSSPHCYAVYCPAACTTPPPPPLGGSDVDFGTYDSGTRYWCVCYP